MAIESIGIYVNAHYEEDTEMALIINGHVALKGDGYHDKISERIGGYLRALHDFNLYTESVPRVEITRDHPHYKALDFYDEEELG